MTEIQLKVANGEKKKDELLVSRTDFRTLVLWLNADDLGISIELYQCQLHSQTASLPSVRDKDGCQQLWITTLLLETPLEWAIFLAVPAKVRGKVPIGLTWAICPTLCQSLWPEE